MVLMRTDRHTYTYLDLYYIDENFDAHIFQAILIKQQRFFLDILKNFLMSHREMT